MTQLSPEVNTHGNIWLRGLYMLLFALLYGVAEGVLSVVVFLQFVIVALSRKKNDELLVFGKRLSVYVYQILRFVTFNSETKPFPFSAWPQADDAPLPSEAADESTQ